MTKLITLRMGNIPITCIYDQPVDILPLDLVYPFLTKDEKGKIEITVHRRDNIARITTKVAASSPSWTMEKRQNCYLFDIYEKELLVANVIVNNSFSKSTVFINSVLERTKFLPLFVFYPILSGYFALNGIGFFFHGAAVQSNAVTLLLTGETGAGKSSCP